MTLQEFENNIMNCPDIYLPEPVERVIDWGKRKKQGKRIGGGMVIGNPDAPRGVKVYRGVNYYKNLPDYDELVKSSSLARVKCPIRYIKARDYGLPHKIAIVFSHSAKKAYEKVMEEQTNE